MSDDERGEEKELDLSSPEVVTKYKSAAEIANKALQLVLSECKTNVKIVDLCEKGDSYIREQTGNMYKNVKKNIERGIAFPTCLSVNNTVCHFSPLASDETVLKEGDILKIDMGCHIDGFIAVVGHKPESKPRNKTPPHNSGHQQRGAWLRRCCSGGGRTRSRR